jgi:hypothetical protein
LQKYGRRGSSAKTDSYAVRTRGGAANGSDANGVKADDAGQPTPHDDAGVGRDAGNDDPGWL